MIACTLKTINTLFAHKYFFNYKISLEISLNMPSLFCLSFYCRLENLIILYFLFEFHLPLDKRIAKFGLLVFLRYLMQTDSTEKI